MTARTILPWALLAASVVLNFVLAAARPGTNSLPAPPAVTAFHPPTPAIPFTVEPTPEPNPEPNSATSLGPISTRSQTYAAFANTLRAESITPTELVVLNQIIGRWLTSDPAAASEWLDAQPDCENYGPAIATVAEFLVTGGDYQSAREWADTIAEPDLRARTTEIIIAEAYRTGAMSAEAVKSADLRPGAVDDILSGARTD